MKSVFYSGISVGALTLTMAFPVSAEITAQQLRDQLVQFYSSVGYQIDIGSEVTANGAVSFSDVTLSSDLGKSGRSVVIGGLSFKLIETGTGAVAIELPEQSNLTVKLLVNGDARLTAELESNLVGFSGLVLGSMDDIQIKTNMESSNIKIVSVNVRGKDFPMTFSLDTSGYSAVSALKNLPEDRRSISTNGSVDSVNLVVNATEPGGPGAFSLTSEIIGLTTAFSVESKKTIDPLAMIAAGFSTSVLLDAASMTTDFSFENKRQQIASSSSMEGGRFSASISPDAIGYDFVEHGVRVKLSSSKLPFPTVGLGFDELKLSFAAPLSKSDTPQDFQIVAALRGLTVDDVIWSIFDGAKTIPRDPASIAVDVSGKVQVLDNIMDPTTLATIDNPNQPPMLPVSFKVNELLASFGGALLTGDGTFKFDFTNPKAAGGVPLPVGELNLNLTGGLGLLDKLSAIRLVPKDAAMGIQAMLGVLARPVGDDAFKSKIEVTADGSVLANGQQIR
jgi:hypothetical protein